MHKDLLMKTNKTPYEIRSDLLHLAFNIVKGRIEAEAANAPVMDKEGTYRIVITKSPTVDEIVAEAQKLNNFVSQSTEK